MIKNYLFYLIDFEAISYNGQKKIIKISDGGLDLLEMIDKEKKQKKGYKRYYNHLWMWIVLKLELVNPPWFKLLYKKMKILFWSLFPNG